MLSVEVADELPGVTDGGVNVPVAPVGKPEAESATAFENVPFCHGDGVGGSSALLDGLCPAR